MTRTSAPEQPESPGWRGQWVRTFVMNEHDSHRSVVNDDRAFVRSSSRERRIAPSRDESQPKLDFSCAHSFQKLQQRCAYLVNPTAGLDLCKHSDSILSTVRCTAVHHALTRCTVACLVSSVSLCKSMLGCEAAFVVSFGCSKCVSHDPRLNVGFDRHVTMKKYHLSVTKHGQSAWLSSVI
jgi:hypothetical protein